MADDSFDVFISYSWRDNADGWVTKLEEQLQKSLCQLGPSGVNVYRDASDARQNELAPVAIDQSLLKARHLIIIYSNNWRNSTYCQTEFDHYWQKSRKSADPVSLYRISCIWLCDFSDERNRLPFPLSSLRGYDFFQGEGDASVPAQPSFRDSKVFRNLLGDIRAELKLDQQASATPTRFALLSPIDCRERRNRLARELAKKGILAYPPPQVICETEKELEELFRPMSPPEGTPFIKFYDESLVSEDTWDIDYAFAEKKRFAIIIWDSQGTYTQTGKVPDLTNADLQVGALDDFIRFLDDTLLDAPINDPTEDEPLPASTDDPSQDGKESRTSSTKPQIGIFADDDNIKVADTFIARIRREVGRYKRPAVTIPKNPTRDFLSQFRAFVMFYGADGSHPQDEEDEKKRVRKQKRRADRFSDVLEEQGISASRGYIFRSPPPLENVPWPDSGYARIFDLAKKPDIDEAIAQLKVNLD